MSINVQRNYEKENWTFFVKHIYIYYINNNFIKISTIIYFLELSIF